MKKLFLTFAFVVIAAATSGEAAAQGRPSLPQRDGEEQPQVPRGFRPPSGMCRIWLEGVPASRQPAPTNCIAALRNKPANGRVIFGDPLPSSKKKGKGGNPFGTGSFEE